MCLSKWHAIWKLQEVRVLHHLLRHKATLAQWFCAPLLPLHYPYRPKTGRGYIKELASHFKLHLLAP